MVVVQQNILGLDVSVNDVLAMSVREGVRDFGGYAECVPHWQAKLTR